MTSIGEIGHIGTTRLLNRHERTIRMAAAIITLLLAGAGLLAGVRVSAWITGNPMPGLRTRPIMPDGTDGGLLTGSGEAQFPIEYVPSPINWFIAAPIAVTILVVGVRFAVLPWLRTVDRNPRHRHLASPKEVRNAFGRKQLRATGAFTLAKIPAAARRRLPIDAFGVYLGEATTPKTKGGLWASFDRRVRLIAAPGWGKTHRFLIPITRKLTGPAIVSSLEVGLFLATAKAREFRWENNKRRRLPVKTQGNPFTGEKGRWVRPQPKQYPVYVVEATPAKNRVNKVYPTIRWNPIPGCEDYNVAKRRAASLVKGVDPEAGTKAEVVTFFENSARDCIAAWFHAAALQGSIEMPQILSWYKKGDIRTPMAILDEHGATPEAAMLLETHLDPQGERTTSGVKRYIAMALASLVSHEGQKIIGSRKDRGQFDFHQLIRDEGTLYLLAEPEQMETLRPVLSLVASEAALAAEQVARAMPGAEKDKRLPRPFYLILDELRYGVRVATLPYIANTLRKFGLMFVYACTNGWDEKTIYGEADAAVLQKAAIGIYGDQDKETGRMLTELAGQGGVVTANRGDSSGEGVTHLDALSIADQQKLKDGESVIVTRGVAPFFAYTPSTFETRRMRRQIRREEKELLAA